jgi:hypothetical protein
MTALSIVSMRSASETDAHSLKAVARLCCIGLIASFCLVTFGMDVSGGWF